MAKQIPIKDVIIDRELEPGDDVSELAQALNDQGQRIPVLLDHENGLIDGLRRIEALRKLGHTTVLATSTSMYAVACSLIKQAREHGVAARPLEPRRIWQMYAATRPIQRITRSAYMTGRKRGQAGSPVVGGRLMFSQAIGFNSQSGLQAINFTYRSLEDPSPDVARRAREAVDLMEQGAISAYQAVEMIKKPPGLTGGLKQLNEQRAALQNGVATLRGLVKGMESLGPINSKMPDEELRGYVGELMVLRAQMYKFIRLLREETNRA